MPINDVTVVIRWILALALGVAAAWLAYGRVGTLARSRAIMLGALRALAVTLVAAILFGAPSAPPRPATPLVAIDVSASSRRAVGDENSVVKAWRERLSEAVKRDAPGAEAFVIVGDSIRDISASDIATLRSDDQGSRVRAAVDRAASLGRPLVLLTDGEVDDAESLAEAPTGSIIRVLANAPRTDGAIADMAVPTTATAGDTITVAATVTAGASSTPDAQLRVMVDGIAPVVLAVPALAALTSTRVTSTIALPRGARSALVRSVLLVPGDAEPRNDTLSTTIDIGDRPSAVFVSTAPDLDVREALVVLRGALNVPTRAFLRVAPGVWRVEGSLAPISEDDVKTQAGAAGMLIVHGDTAWRPRAAARSATGAKALWIPAPPTTIARAGELARTPEWYASGVPASPLAAALAGLPLDSLPPLTLAGPARGAMPVLTAQLGKRGDAVPAIAARIENGVRTVVVSGSGYAGWALRGGRSAEAFGALWGAIFDWLAAGRGDVRAARPIASLMRAGDPVAWRRGGVDSIVAVRLSRRGGTAIDSLTLRFTGSSFETTSPALAAGVYDVQAEGGASVLVVNASREWVPRAPTVRDGVLSRGALSSDAPRLADAGWPFVLALLLLCGEWIGRRAGGYR
ncbi:hypothetical protein [Gemmatimonas groenlandica]|uniref:Uncharacterized protein n=1 Tax=Gemmatimonas groenlandica TaxID=2732249 RepID=A0A6M4IMI9_9BACT|nr:hypothetical protein [Gemmatimonas groenlandica]QJR35295.1 hypothetical protein HKW67_07140 [Gemmatimonas groenlandica]